MSHTLLIFTKNPRLGKVKTRLAATSGDAEALRIYRILLEKTREAALGVVAGRWLFYSDELEPNDAWAAADFEKKVQCAGDLGARMEDAFRQAFAAGATRVLIIGSDCPVLDGTMLQQAFEQLTDSDFVLGPTPDGGYYLLGMRHFEPSVFRNMAWSTEQVRASTLAAIRAGGWTCAELPILSDIDTEADWRAYLESV
ncbi:MAG: TIGR04282 family arsenosugar biosynthesis glycosyltransferase [Saprospiraceae bacterium]|nr:TIGR04282 family arsenosugar biosynthesis glycosyltransferase [Saprospiraceae bacterium]